MYVARLPKDNTFDVSGHFQDKEKDKTDSPQSGNAGKTDPSVQGFFSQYVPKPGVQYYRDLAGNIKQVPCLYLSRKVTAV